MRKYQELVRPDAPWCPDNIEFIRRINGLDSIDDVQRTIFDASYLVLGLGDVYLGAPVATPIDPRHRLVTTKYNPARTWTPENAVGIGGAYMCIYGMEGPGGYQLVRPHHPGLEHLALNPGLCSRQALAAQLLRPDPLLSGQPRRTERCARRLPAWRLSRPHRGRLSSPTPTTPRELAANAPSIAAFKTRQQAAFDAERQRWKDEGLDSFVAADASSGMADGEIPVGCFGVASHVPGNIWKILVEDGAEVELGQPVAIIESMKMEITVTAHAAGRVRELRAGPGRNVKTGDVIIVLEEV